MHKPVEIDTRTHLRRNHRVNQTTFEDGDIDVDPDKPTASDFPADLVRAETSPRSITKIEKLGTNSGRANAGLQAGGSRVGDDMDHHESDTFVKTAGLVTGVAEVTKGNQPVGKPIYPAPPATPARTTTTHARNDVLLGRQGLYGSAHVR